MTTTPNKGHRLKALLGKGFLPNELPPPFVSTRFAAASTALAAHWGDASNAPATQFEVFSFPRVGHARRNLAVVNPVSYFHLATFLANNWVEIRRFLKKSSYSKSIPEFTPNSRRALRISRFEELEMERLLISSRHSYILRTDIVRFYPSIYTHSIPWAFYSKLWCKSNLHSALKNTLGHTIDILVRKCQDNQTGGIPIGPDTSRIVAEIATVGIDISLQNTLKLNSVRAYRYIDDFYLGFDQHSECEEAIHAILKALLQYELDINNDKTSICGTEDSIEPDWPYEIRRFRFGRSVVRQRRSLEEYFHRAIVISKNYPFDNVLEYAIKRTMSIRIYRRNWIIYQAFLIKVGRMNPASVPTIVQILVNYHHLGYDLEKDVVTEFIEDGICHLTPRGRHGELAWMLFLAKALRVSLQRNVARLISDIESSVCALLALDLRTRGLIKDGLNLDPWIAALEPDGLRSNLWLLAYEADLKGWLKPKVPNFVENDRYFSELKARGISFYDEGRNVEKMSRTMQRQKQWVRAWDHKILGGGPSA